MPARGGGVGERAAVLRGGGAPRRGSLVPVVGSVAERLREPSPPRRRSLVVVVRPSACPTPPAPDPMETQSQDVAHSPAEVPNDPGKMFVGGLSWQTSPGTHVGRRPHSDHDVYGSVFDSLAGGG
ncbi:unnamed protein product [Parnassius apollo]|uniref:(apollo) hypothetical protein n=1 Tax=Parnassius apollo TaxID=110799 RepID=A0A8S3XBD2_PARAO|nr:unnamed protein product [Parnassius apollo]